MRITTIYLVLLLSMPAWASNTVDIHGFVSQGFFLSNNYNFLSDRSTDGSWEMREVGLNFQKELGDRFRVGIQFLSRDVGVYGDNSVILDWAYGSISISDPLNLSIGRNKMPFGIFSEIQDFDFLTPYAILPSAIYDKGIRSLTSFTDGIMVNGNISKNGSFKYSLSLGNNPLQESSDYHQYIALLGYTFADNVKIDYVFNANTQYSLPVTDLTFNASYMRMDDYVASQKNGQNRSPVLSQHTDINWWVAGVQYLGTKIDFFSELHHRYTVQEIEFATNTTVVDTVNRGGWYIGINVKPTGLFHIGGYFQNYVDRYDEYSYVTGKVLDPKAASNLNREGALTTTFNIQEYLTIKIEGHLVYGTALLSPLSNDGGFDNGDYWQYGIIKLTYNF